MTRKGGNDSFPPCNVVYHKKSEKAQSGRQRTVHRVYPFFRKNSLLDKNVHGDTAFGGNLRAILQIAIYLT